MIFFRGPEGTCFEGGVFPAKLIFPPDYPLSPPKMRFTCEMFHPNSKYFGSVFYFLFPKTFETKINIIKTTKTRYIRLCFVKCSLKKDQRANN